MEMFTRRKVPWSLEASNTQTPSGSTSTEDGRRGEPLGPMSPSLSNPLHLDHSSILLILSCHLRLMDIYDQLFLHMKVCLKQRGSKGMEYNPKQAYFQAPKLTIGKFVPPPETAVPMQILLLVHFVTTLSDYATELEGHIRQPENGIASSRSFENDRSGNGVAALSLASAQKVKERATGMVQDLGFLRSSMQSEGIVA